MVEDLTREACIAWLRDRGIMKCIAVPSQANRRWGEVPMLVMGFRDNDRWPRPGDPGDGIELPEHVARAALRHRLVGFDLRSLPP